MRLACLRGGATKPAGGLLLCQAEGVQLYLQGTIPTVSVYTTTRHTSSSIKDDMQISEKPKVNTQCNETLWLNQQGEGRLWAFVFTTTDKNKCQNRTPFFEYVLCFLIRLPPVLELCDPKIDYLWHPRHFIKKLCWTPATATRISPHSNRLLPFVYSPVRLKPSPALHMWILYGIGV